MRPMSTPLSFGTKCDGCWTDFLTRILRGMDNELAYLAGFFDGEGCISINRNSSQHYGLLLAAAQINPAPLFLLYQRFGGYIVRKQRPTDRYRAVHQWRSSGREAADVLRQLQPYLVVKKEEADIAIEFQELMAVPTERSPSGVANALSERADLYVRCKALKHRNFDDVVLPRAAKRGRKAGTTGARLSAGRGTGKPLLSRRGSRDPERLARMRELRESGLTLEAIAEEFNTSKANVWQLLNRYRRKPVADLLSG